MTSERWSIHVAVNRRYKNFHLQSRPIMHHAILFAVGDGAQSSPSH